MKTGSKRTIAGLSQPAPIESAIPLTSSSIHALGPRQGWESIQSEGNPERILHAFRSQGEQFVAFWKAEDNNPFHSDGAKMSNPLKWNAKATNTFHSEQKNREDAFRLKKKEKRTRNTLPFTSAIRMQKISHSIQSSLAAGIELPPCPFRVECHSSPLNLDDPI